MATQKNSITGYTSDHAYYAISNAKNGYHDSSNTSYASVNLTRGANAETYVFWKFADFTIPTNSTIDSVVCKGKARVSNSSSSYISVARAQLYAGSTAKGNYWNIRNTSTSAWTMGNPGTWTAAELNAGVLMRTFATRGTSRTTSNYYIYFYGADLEITYTEITGTKVHIKVGGEWVEGQKIYTKVNGAWSEVSKVFKKSNNAWSQQADVRDIFDTNALFINGV